MIRHAARGAPRGPAPDPGSDLRGRRRGHRPAGVSVAVGTRSGVVRGSAGDRASDTPHAEPSTVSRVLNVSASAHPGEGEPPGHPVGIQAPPRRCPGRSRPPSAAAARRSRGGCSAPRSWPGTSTPHRPAAPRPPGATAPPQRRHLAATSLSPEGARWWAPRPVGVPAGMAVGCGPVRRCSRRYGSVRWPAG